MRKGGNFYYRANNLYADGVPIRKIAAEFGTPLYVYSSLQLESNVSSFQKAFADVPHQICYALKANSNLHLLRLIGSFGCGADVVSGGELQLAMRAGISPSRIVFAGVGKTEDEITMALECKVSMLNVESHQELILLDRVAKKVGRRACIALRINPDVAVGTHPYIATGRRQHKFGFASADAVSMYSFAARLSNVQPIGIHMHLGSQIKGNSAYKTALRKAIHLIEELRNAGTLIEALDIGGGFGIEENGDFSVDLDSLAKAVRRALLPLQLRVLLEPGRSIVANSGVLITKVLYTKQTSGRNFVVVDAGMNDFIRPALYKATHLVLPCAKRVRKRIKADVVGPVCETGDFLAVSQELEQPEPGDLLAVLNAGAYGFSMSSNYNSRARAAEVLVKKNNVKLIRRRETLDDMLITSGKPL